jgi:aldose 1-epimerase
MRHILPLCLLILVCACSRKEPAPAQHPFSVTTRPFGTLPAGDSVRLFTLRNPAGMAVSVMNYGGIITSLTAPDKNGAYADVVLGYDSLSPYLPHPGFPYFGALVGRYANRIARGKFSLDGKSYALAVNNGVNALHGGIRGFDKVLWQVTPSTSDSSADLLLRYRSPDGEEGYPGTLDVTVTYRLTRGNSLEITYASTTDAPSIVNLTQHSYFNLAGAGRRDILDHELMINADLFTPVDDGLIPTGTLQDVGGTPMDFRSPTPIGKRISLVDEQLKRGGGYDHNWALHRTGGGLERAAEARDPESGRTLEILTTEPGLQFYSGNFLDGTLTGKGNHVYGHRFGFCLETQHFPDSPHHPGFPSTVLRPGEEYHSTTIMRFSVR